MATTYFGTTINESPTIVMQAGEAIESGARGIALMASADGLKKPTAGAVPIGLSLFTGEDTVAKGDDVTVQVKDIGKWIASEAIKTGDLLATDADGKAKVAASGEFIFAVALGAAEAAGQIIQVQIIKAGYAAAASSGN